MDVYRVTDDEWSSLQFRARGEIDAGIAGRPSHGRAFVLWAAEAFRRDGVGNREEWAFLMGPLGRPEAEWATCKTLTDRGLAWWGRPVHRAGGVRRYLGTLRAEGGLPASLKSPGSPYGTVLRRLVREARGGASRDVLVRIAEAQILHGTWAEPFRNAVLVHRAADLAASLGAMLHMVPEGASPTEWLDAHRAGWREAGALRLPGGDLDAVLSSGGPAGPDLAVAPLERSLRLRGGRWTPFVSCPAEATLAASSIRLGEDVGAARLLPTGDFAAAAPDLTILLERAEAAAWALRSLSRPHARGAPWDLDRPVRLKAVVDGTSEAEVVIDAAWSPEDGPVMGGWTSTGDTLVQCRGGLATRGPVLGVLVATGAEIHLDGPLEIGRERAAYGDLIWLRGAGRIVADGHAHPVRTEAADLQDRVLMLAGPHASGVMGADGAQVFSGRPAAALWRDGFPEPVPDDRLSWTGRVGAVRATLRDGADALHARAIVLPRQARIRIDESALVIEGMPGGTLVRAQSTATPEIEIDAGAGRGAVRLALADPAALEVALDLLLPGRGDRPVRLVARRAVSAPVLIDPDGRALEPGRRAEVELSRLAGWIAAMPASGGTLHVRLGTGAQERGGLRLGAGRTPLSAIASYVASLLSLETADGTVLLEAGEAAIRVQRAWASLPGRTFAEWRAGPHDLRAFSLDAPGQVWEAGADPDPPGPGRWIIWGRDDAALTRPRLHDGGPPDPELQQAFGLAMAAAGAHATRDARTAAFEAALDGLLDAPDVGDWHAVERLIEAAADGPGAAWLDQVQALAGCPAAAVALLGIGGAARVPQGLALSEAAPFAWITTAPAAYGRGIAVAEAILRRRLADLGGDAAGYARDAVLRAVEEVARQRPDLMAHLMIGIEAADARGRVVQAAGAEIAALTDPDGYLGARVGILLDQPVDRSGLSGLRAQALPRALQVGDGSHGPMLAAPVVAAEAALGRRTLSRADLGRLLLARAAARAWFDAALPAAMAWMEKRT